MPNDTAVSAAPASTVVDTAKLADTTAKPAEAVAKPAEVAPAAEAKPAETKPAVEAKPAETKPAEAAKPAVPEKYEITAPEGVTLNPAVVEKAQGVFKEIGLTQESAQKVFTELAPVIAAQQMEQFNALDARWLESTKTDKEIGGDGLKENLGIAAKAMDQFVTPEFKKFLNESRLGNHPEMVRAFVRIGKAISDDKFVPGTVRGNGAARSNDERLAATLYPTRQ